MFTAYPPHADIGSMLQRLMSPFAALRITAKFADPKAALRGWPFRPAQQHFVLYVPPGPAPAGGYTLLVFVPPWKQARVPVQWIPVLNRTHTLFVTAADSGNSAQVFERREPLALVAADNVPRLYHVNPSHIYVGGFSGGSRVALRLALAFPDVFRGALLDAGSDPIGTATVPLPPRAVFERFQQSSRIVFVTGDEDQIRQTQLARAQSALHDWCVFDVDSLTLLHTGHTLADGAGFARALDALMRTSAPNEPRLQRCRAHHHTALAAGLQRVRALIDARHLRRARQVLDAIDDRYGGLAAPQSVALLRRISAAPTTGK